ncbi:glycosyltransferase [Telmatocola sphagniphila]|uniref:Glycosyltransferase n=1 Tax=Telmatocola sphagniphila TaxID=1123043 RepID=A0A8E6BAV6_9BACT|nr:glycosyltransferase [Telmatocola sphagniphila]QVL33768.1 glycosyltransferase [Telmatocola sphagniphila]
MKVLHVVHSLDPSTGGTASAVRSLVAQQQRRGLQAAMAAEIVPTTDLETAQKLSPSRWWDFFWNPGFQSTRIQSFDLVHLHGVWDRPLLQVIRAARQLQKPYVLSPHGMLDPWSLSQKRLKKKLFLQLVVKRFLDQAGAIHFLNSDEADLTKTLRITAPAAIIPNGIEVAAAPSDLALANFRQRYALGDVAPFLLFLSRLHFKKGLDYLVEAFAKIASAHPSLKLVVAGPDDGARADFEKLIASRNLTERVVLTGPLYGEQKQTALLGAAVFVLPSRQEGFSVAILEALAAQIPVVITKACHFPEVESSRAGYVTDLDADQIAGALDKILSNPQARQTMGPAGRELVTSRYSWDRVIGQFEDLYGSVVAQARR